MATTLYLAAEATNFIGGWGYTAKSGSGTPILETFTVFTTSRGSGLATQSANTVNGLTAGIEFAGASAPIFWVSKPFSSDITISGSITFNLWASESSMSANATISCQVFRIDTNGMRQDSIIDSTFGTELTTTRAAKNWSGTPTSTVVHKGERVMAMVYIDDATGVTMNSGYSCSLGYAATSAAADGDSYITFNENITFLDDSSGGGTSFYLRSTAAEVDPNGADYDAFALNTSAGSSSSLSTYQSAGSTGGWFDGWSSSVYLTKNATNPNNYLEWFSPRLNAFTLGGNATFTTRAFWTLSTNTASLGVELAIVDANGANPTIWARANNHQGISSAGTDITAQLFGDDISFTAGNRLRLRTSQQDGSSRIVAGYNLYYYYDGNTLATGEAKLVLPATVTTYTATAQVIMINMGD